MPAHTRHLGAPHAPPHYLFTICIAFSTWQEFAPPHELLQRGPEGTIFARLCARVGFEAMQAAAERHRETQEALEGRVELGGEVRITIEE